jgi:hypothetical protein
MQLYVTEILKQDLFYRSFFKIARISDAARHCDKDFGMIQSTKKGNIR